MNGIGDVRAKKNLWGKVCQVFLLVFLLLSSTLLSSCYSKVNNSNQDTLKILNSFSPKETLYQIWPNLFQMFQRTYERRAVAQNIEPRSLLYRMRRLNAVDSFPNVIYSDLNSDAGRYLLENNLLQNLRGEQQSGALSLIPFSPLALVPQGFGDNMLWFIPLKLHINGVLFANDQLLQKEGIQMPRNIKELKDSINTLRDRGYKHPLVLGYNYNKNIFNNLLGTFAGQYIDLNFFKNATQNPELYQSPEFRGVLKRYLSYTADDGLLSKELRKMIYGEGLVLFSMEQSVFFLGDSVDSDYLNLSKGDSFLNNISWHAFPGEESLTSSEEYFSVPGSIQPGYGVTRATQQKSQIQQGALEFLNFMFSSGIQMYAKEDKSQEIFSVINDSIESRPFYQKKKDFYNQTISFIDDIRNTMVEGQYEILEKRIERVSSGFNDIDSIINVFYTNAINHRFNFQFSE